MKHRMPFNKNQNSPLNAMSGDISCNDLKGIPGISTMALRLKAAQENKKASSLFSKRNSVCALADVKQDDISYQNLSLVSKQLSRRGKITSTRINGISRKKQRFLRSAIKRQRNLGIIPVVNYGEHKI